MVQQAQQQNTMRRRLPYDQWMESQDLPVHRGHFVANPTTVELGWWEERGCNSAFIQLEGMQGVCEARITEIRPGDTAKPLKMSVGELIYVLDGQGIATVWAGAGEKKVFEFQKHSLFYLPRNCHHQFSNSRGDKPTKLLNYNHLPVAMSVIGDPDFFFNKNPLEEPERLYNEDFYSAAKLVETEIPGGKRGQGASWHGNFFPDMRAWDKLVPFWGRGAGGHRVGIRFPGGEMDCHMSVFDPQLYKKAHKHGPGRVIVIPTGEGYSVLWPADEGGEKDKVICPWSEGSIFVPVDNWYHQHFNVGEGEARYLALHAMPQFSGNPYRHQIEYPYEEPWVRETFEKELAKRNLKTLMPDEAYEDPNYEFEYGDDD